MSTREKKMRTVGKATHIRAEEKFGTIGIVLDGDSTKRLLEALTEAVADDRYAYIWVEKKNGTVHLQMVGQDETVDA
jgi:hypothetical protein